MIHSLGIEMANEREAYFSDSEYAAALLSTKVEAIAGIVSEDPLRQPRGDADRPVAGNGSAAARVKPATAPRLRNMLIVWAPLVAGLVALAALAIVSRIKL